MIYEKIYLHENEDDVYFEMFCSDDSEEYWTRKRPAILIIPGGGYQICSDREGETIVRLFMSLGYNCACLRYSTCEKASSEMPKASRPLLEASKAMSLMRENAEKWHIIPDKIAVIGFSAGGHLAGTLGTMWDDDSIYENLDIPFGSNKPNAMILSYPVALSGENAHRGSFDILLGKYKDDKELLEKYDIVNRISDNTPPTFIWHTYTDDCVPVENALRFCEEMRKKSKSSCELHIFCEGGHGMSICTKEVACDNAYVGKWKELCASWLEKIFK
ncbi:MAG: alpha/beta hydrolase [Clostridia bacterium]|nr:alpha/beta hydrolase [Clostridia bacterium]